MPKMDLSGAVDGELCVDEALVPVADFKRAGTSSLNFDGLLSSPIQLHEDLKEGCGGQLWPAGVVLTKYLLKSPRWESMEGKKMFVSFESIYQAT